MLRKTNWAAVSALAAVAGVLITLTTHTAMPSTYNPDPTGQPSVTSPAAPAPTHNFSGPNISSTTGPPTGCEQGKAAITRYNETVGPTWYGEADAAQQADQAIGPALETTPQGAIWSDLDAIYLDFGHMSELAMEQDSIHYSDVRDQAKRDIKEFYTDCKTG